MKKFVVIVLAIAVLVGGYLLVMRDPKTTQSPSSGNTSEKVRIGFSMGTLKEERWQKDAGHFTDRAKELGAVVDVMYSGEDSALQISQAENLILQGAKALVVVPQDAAAAAVIVEKAHAAGVKVIAYDRMITGSDLDLYISFDSRKVGEIQASEVVKKVAKGNVAYIGGSPTDNNAYLLKEGSMAILDPLVKKGDMTIVVDAFSPGWSPEEAYKTIKTYLATGKKLDAVVAANDGTASGVIRALAERGLAGKVPVSGQDADLTACQRVVEGTQTVTVYKPLKDLAYKAAEAAVALAEGRTVETNGTLNNGKIDVPAYFLDLVAVTKDNMESFITTYGFHTREEVFK
jgi:D-xylose transport system substrate-binding protein